jgi:hypothetical protein
MTPEPSPEPPSEPEPLSEEDLDAEYEDWAAWEEGAYGPDTGDDPLPRFEVIQAMEAFRQGDTHVRQEPHRKPRLTIGVASSAGSGYSRGWRRLLARLVPFRRRRSRRPLQRHRHNPR